MRIFNLLLQFLLKFLVNFFSDLISLQNSHFMLDKHCQSSASSINKESLGLYLLSNYKVYRILFLRGGSSSCGSTLSSWAGSGSSGVL